MSVLVDTNVLVGAKEASDSRHESASRGLGLAVKGRWGRPVVSDLIVDEALTLARVRTRSHASAEDLAAFLLGEPPYERIFDVVPIDRSTFAAARTLFRRYDDRFLSFTDCTSIALSQLLNLQVLSFDRGFDGLVPRIDPAGLA